jgi:hypothetical protein
LKKAWLGVKISPIFEKVFNSKALALKSVQHDQHAPLFHDNVHSSSPEADPIKQTLSKCGPSVLTYGQPLI